jgi:heme exporter protein C
MQILKKDWWKILAVILMLYVLPMAWTGDVSVQVILHESIRNLYFHVTMWFAMTLLFAGSAVQSILFLINERKDSDTKAEQMAHTSMAFGIIGIITGMIWATYTWGAPWVNDPKLNGAAVALLIYIAYFILRNSIDDTVKKARTAAVYNIFAFVMLILLIGVMPRLQNSLHPGNGGNPGFGGYDLKGTMRPVFYSGVIAWTLVGYWIAELRFRWKKMKIKLEETEE